MRIFKKGMLRKSTYQLYRLLVCIFVALSFVSTAKNTAKAQSVGLNKALGLYKDQKYEGAYQTLNAIKDKNYKEYALLILSAKKLNKIEEAISILEKASQKFPKEEKLKRELALTLEQKANAFPQQSKDFMKVKIELKNKTVAILRSLYEENPSAENFTALVQYYSREKNYVEMLSLLELYSRDNVKGEIYYTYLCEGNFHSKFYTDAEEICKFLAEQYPKNKTGEIYYAKALEKNGKEKEALKKYKEVIQRFPASKDAYLSLAKNALQKGETDEGLGYLEKHIALDPTDEALVLKAETLFEQKQYKKALATYIKACKQHKEPRKPLIFMMVQKTHKIQDKKLRNLYERESQKCKYDYRPKKEAPRGYINSESYTKSGK